MGCAKISRLRLPATENDIEVTTETPPARRRRPHALYDIGYLTSSESDADTPTSDKIKWKWDATEILPDNHNAMQCYFCFEDKGILLTMPLCRCKVFAHKKCLMTYVSSYNLRCSICKELYCEKNEKENKFDTMQRIMTVIKDREAVFQRKIFINSILGVT